MDVRLDSVYKCITELCSGGAETYIVCGTDYQVGDTLTYEHKNCDGGYYNVYDSSDNLISSYSSPATPGDDSNFGGGFVVTQSCHRVCVGPTVKAYKVSNKTVRTILGECTGLVDLIETLDKYGFTEEDMQQVINMYLDNKSAGGVAVPLNAFFTMYVDANGNLYAKTTDDGARPPLLYEEDTGNLYWEVE